MHHKQATPGANLVMANGITSTSGQISKDFYHQNAVLQHFLSAQLDTGNTNSDI